MRTVLLRESSRTRRVAFTLRSYCSQKYLFSPSKASSLMNKSNASDNVFLFLISSDSLKNCSSRSEVYGYSVSPDSMIFTTLPPIKFLNNRSCSVPFIEVSSLSQRRLKNSSTSCCTEGFKACPSMSLRALTSPRGAKYCFSLSFRLAKMSWSW